MSFLGSSITYGKKEPSLKQMREELKAIVDADRHSPTKVTVHRERDDKTGVADSYSISFDSYLNKEQKAALTEWAKEHGLDPKFRLEIRGTRYAPVWAYTFFTENG